MSNHHTQYNYYKTILDNKELIVTSEFGVKPKLLTINIDFGDLDNDLTIDESNIKSSIEKKSRDTIFIKTYIIINNLVVASSSSVWTKSS